MPEAGVLKMRIFDAAFTLKIIDLAEIKREIKKHPLE